MNDIEEAMLLRMCKRVDVSKSIYLRIKRRVNENKFGSDGDQQTKPPHKNMSLSQAGNLLGITRWTSKEEVKKTYRRLMSQFHPDKMLARGCSPDEVELATSKFQNIQYAYELISKARHIR